ncbi:MAG: hypothetical protein M0Q93_01060 [Terrimicrobiaceae bacterium]|jgi:DNA ligase-1|nr:hypothetical protein [Terrimicrobiaceae bacterium]
MNIITKPMLAGKCESVNNLKFPVLGTPKLDGIRCLIREGGEVVSRNFKPIPNLFVRRVLGGVHGCGIPGMDGELMIRGTNSFQAVSSGVMSQDGTPDFEYWVFDHVASDLLEAYSARMARLEILAAGMAPMRIRPVLPVKLKNVEELLAYEEKCLAEGFEGIMVRTPNSPYKCGRSSEREGYLLKVKRFDDAEATVIGFKERLHNSNEATKDELGRTKRSSHQENMVPMGTLGALCCRTKDGVEFDIGTGFDDALRAKLWASRDTLKGKLVKYKSQPTGVKDKPRFPVFLGFRSEDDI